MHSDGISLEEMRGFSISEEPFPAIVLNGYDRPRGRIFTLIHELTHVLMRSGAVCNLLDQPNRKSDAARIETFCNRIAGAVLLPQAEMVEEAFDAGVEAPISWSDVTLSHLANRYHVSREAVLRRMVTLDYATLDYYFRKLFQYNQIYEEEREQERLERERRKREGLPPKKRPDTLVIRLRNLGRRYTNGVARAYGSRYIDAAELSEYLDTKIEHVPPLVALLDRRG